MADKIQIKRSSEEGKKPTPEQLADGELALNLKDKKIYAKDSEGVVQEFPAVESVDVGVEKVNDLTGEITIKGSDNINVTKSGQNLTLNTTGNVALKSDVPAQVNLIEGTGINITGDYPDKTITNKITDLGDLDSVVIDGQSGIAENSVLTFTDGNWTPGTGGGSSDVDELNDLSDVTLDGVATNQIMQYSGGQWRNVDVPGAAGQTTVNGLSGAVFLEGQGSVSISKPDPNDDNKILISGTSGVPEANSDGKIYGRQNAAWVEIEATSGDENVQSNWTETDQTSDAFILNKPTKLTDFENDLTLPPADAEKNVQSDWDEVTTTSDAYILNKPTNLSQFKNDITIDAGNVTNLPVTNLESGNELTLNVKDEGNGTWTLTALNQGSGGGGSGNLNLLEGDCITIDAAENASDANVTDITIGLDTDCDSIACNLPISDDRTPTTVTLSSPSENTFAIKTNDVDNRLAVNARGMIGVGNAGSNSICLYVDSVPTNATGLNGVISAPKIITADAEEVAALKTQINLDAGVDLDFYHHLVTSTSSGTGTVATVNGVRVVDTSMTGTTKNVAFSTNLPADNLKNYSIETGTAPSVFNGQIQCNTYTTVDGAANEPKIEFSTSDAKITVGSSYYQLYSSGYHVFQCDGSQSRFTNDGRFLVNTQTPDDGYLSTFLQNKTGETGIARWVTQNTDGTCSLWFDCDPKTNIASLKTTNTLSLQVGDGDERIDLSTTEVTISTGGAARWKVKNGTHPYGIIQTATGGGAGNATAYRQENTVIGTRSSQYGFTVVTEVTGDGNSIANGYGFSCNAPDNTNNVTDSWRSFNANIVTDNAAADDTILYYAGAGNPITDKYYAFYAKNLRSFFGGGVFCNTYTTEDGANTDAKITLLDNAMHFEVGNQILQHGGYSADYSGGTFAGLGPSSNYIWSKTANGFAIAADRIRFNSSVSTGATAYQWSMETDGALVSAKNGAVEASFLKSSRNDVGDAVFDLTDGVKLTTDQQFVVYRNDNSQYVASSGASVMTKNDVDTALAALNTGGFPVESLPSKNIQIIADDNKGIVEYIAKYQTQNNTEDPDSNKTWRDDPVQFFYAGAKEESWKTFGGPALRITLQGVIETGLAYNTNDQGVTGSGMEGIRNCRFYATIQEASSSATGTTYKWDEASYVFMAKENPLDGGNGVIDDNTSSPDGLGIDQYSLLTIREGSATSASDIHITANSRYTPTYDYDLITKKYLDEFVLPLPDPDSPLPPVGIGAGLTWDELESTPGLYLSGVYGINGIFSVIGYSDLESSLSDRVSTQELACYWSADGRTWQEGFVGGTFTALQNTTSGTFYWIPTPNNKYGRYCDGAQTIFTGHAFTSTGKTWQGFWTDGGSASTDTVIGEGVPIYWDSGIKTDTATDPNTGTRPFSDWPEGQAWITSRGYAIQDLEDDDASGVINIQNDAPTTNTDVALTESGLVICPKVFFHVGGNEDFYRTNYQIYKPLQSYAVIQQAQPTDALATYFRPVTVPVYQDACCSPDGKTVLALDSQDNQFYWYQHKRTTLTVPTGLWQIDGLCCSYDKSRGYFVAVTADKVYAYEAPSNSGFNSSDVYGGKLIWTYTIPQAAEWTHLSISGGIYLLMSKSGLMARLDINDSENPTNRTFEMIGANSPTVYSANPVLAGTNGRFLVTGGEDIDGFDDFGSGQGTIPIANVPAGPPRDQKYAWSGGVNDPGASTTTDDVELTDPVDTGGGQRSTRKLLTTQKDANEYFAEEIAKRAVVVTLTQAEYDAIPADEIDDNTLYLIT